MRRWTAAGVHSFEGRRNCYQGSSACLARQQAAFCKQAVQPPSNAKLKGTQVSVRAGGGGLRSSFDRHVWKMRRARAKRPAGVHPLEHLIAPAASSAGGGRLRNGTATAHTVVALREVAGDFLKRMPTQKCASCGCNNPGIKRWAQLLSRALTIVQRSGLLFRSRICCRLQADADFSAAAVT